jgi:diguanylate cyclase (GGDEF)-like protein
VRISFIVFCATLITSLAVTAISGRSIEGFLRNEIEQNFPAVLETASRHLDLWYDQRLLEVGVFSTSRILSENASLLTSDTRSRRAERATREVGQYFRYLLDSSPQYDAVFVLDLDSERLLWVGAPFELPKEVLRGALAGTTEPRLSRAISTGTEIVQLVSAPLLGPRTRPWGSLHAVLHMNAVADVLSADEVGEVGEVFLLDASRNYLAASPERMSSGTWSPPELNAETGVPLLDYSDHGGQRVVGFARPFERFGWTLAIEEPYGEAFKPVVSAIRRVLAINLAIVLFFALAAFRAARSIAQPIEALSDTARRISEGERRIEIPYTNRRDEVGILTRAFRSMTHRLESNTEQMQDQNTELQRMNEILEQLSITDGLTHLHNHRYFQEQLAKDVNRSNRSGEPLALVLIDIDDFKGWNDQLGHSGGDEILRRIAEIMQGLTRETDLLARYGGEEFALLLPATEIEGAQQLAEKIRSTIAGTRFFGSESKPLTVSIGVSAFSGDRKDFFDQADRALYRAKHAGRDCVMVASEEEAN